MNRLPFVFTLLALWVCVGSVQNAFAAGRIGVVILHEHNVAPDRSAAKITESLDHAGFLVDRPEMPWSNLRGFDSPVEDAFKDIDASVMKMRAKGAERIVLAGHGLGAAAALAYAAAKPGICAVVLLAPAHQPERWREELASSLVKARLMIEESRGHDRAVFSDVKQTEISTIPMRADAYFSYYNPDGLMAMAASMKRLPSQVALLWAVGTADELLVREQVEDLARQSANPKNRYLVVNADHLSTPDAAARDVVDWIATACR